MKQKIRSGSATTCHVACFIRITHSNPWHCLHASYFLPQQVFWFLGVRQNFSDAKTRWRFIVHAHVWNWASFLAAIGRLPSKEVAGNCPRHPAVNNMRAYRVFAVFVSIADWFHVVWQMTKMLVVEVRGDITSKVRHFLWRTWESKAKNYRPIAAGAIDNSPLVQGNFAGVVFSLRVVGELKILTEHLQDIKWTAYSAPAIPAFWFQDVQ